MTTSDVMKRSATANRRDSFQTIMSQPQNCRSRRDEVLISRTVAPPHVGCCGLLKSALGLAVSAALILTASAAPDLAGGTSGGWPDLVPPADGTKVLLVTGIDYPGHHWQQTAPAVKEVLEEDARLKVRIVADPNALASPDLHRWDVVLLHFQNWEVPGPGESARDNLKRFVAGGKGVLLTHFACGAWYGEWPEFKALAGRAWFGPQGGRQHDPYGTFRVEIADPAHAITKGLAAFETKDELYTCLTGDAPIHVLATARSKVDQEDYPMAFVLNYGQGRVFHTVLGHDVNAYTNASVPELLRRGCAWAAGLAPR